MGSQDAKKPERRGEATRLRLAMIAARLVVFAIVGVWVLSGFGKVMDLSGFVNTVIEHRVLPQSMFWILWGIGPAEVVLGLVLVFAAGSELNKPFGRAVLVVSLAGLSALTAYLSMVDEAQLLESGCGCLDALDLGVMDRVNFGMDTSERAVKLAFNGVLIALHLFALIVPALVMRRVRVIDAARAEARDRDDGGKS